jgi:hypothetical protein
MRRKPGGERNAGDRWSYSSPFATGKLESRLCLRCCSLEEMLLLQYGFKFYLKLSVIFLFI